MLGDGGPAGLWVGSGLRAAGGCGTGAELLDVLGRAAFPGMGAGGGGQAEVAADFGDDFGDWTGGEVVLEVGGVEAVVQLGLKVGAVTAGGALDCVFDFPEDALAGGGAVLGRVAGGRCGLGEAAGQEDAPADGAGEAVEGDREGDQGVWCWSRLRSGSRCGLGLSGSLLVQEAGEVGAHGDQVVQDLPVERGVCGLLAGVVGCGLGLLGGHERNKNIVGFVVSRLA